MTTIKLGFFGQVKSKKNSKRIGYNRRTGAPFIHSSEAVKAQEAQLVAAFVDDFYGDCTDKKTRDAFLAAEAYEVEIRIWNQNRNRHDLDNQAATIMDALVKAGVLRDDNQEIVRKITIELGGVDREAPRAQIIIKTLDGAENGKN